MSTQNNDNNDSPTFAEMLATVLADEFAQPDDVRDIALEVLNEADVGGSDGVSAGDLEALIQDYLDPYITDSDLDDQLQTLESRVHDSLAPRTYCDNIAVVSSRDKHHNTIQSALDSHHNRVHLHEITDEQSWPVRITDQRAYITADFDVVVEDYGDVAFRIEAGHRRPPGPRIEGIEVRGGGTAFEVIGTKYTEFRQCHVQDCDVGWKFRDSNRNSPNSNTLTKCTAQAPRIGVDARARAHSLILDGFRGMHASEYGILGARAAKIDVRGGQLEDCGLANIKLKNCLSPTVRDCYIEGGGYDGGGDGDSTSDGGDPRAEVIFEDCVKGSVKDCYFQGLNKTDHGIAVCRTGEDDQPSIADNSFRRYNKDHIAHMG